MLLKSASFLDFFFPFPFFLEESEDDDDDDDDDDVLIAPIKQEKMTELNRSSIELGFKVWVTVKQFAFR